MVYTNDGILKITPKAARVNAGLSQKQAAEMLGVSRSTLQNHENGRTKPSVPLANRMAQLYKCPFDCIFFE